MPANSDARSTAAIPSTGASTARRAFTERSASAPRRRSSPAPTWTTCRTIGRACGRRPRRACGIPTWRQASTRPVSACSPAASDSARQRSCPPRLACRAASKPAFASRRGPLRSSTRRSGWWAAWSRPARFAAACAPPAWSSSSTRRPSTPCPPRRAADIAARVGALFRANGLPAPVSLAAYRTGSAFLR